MFILFLVQLSNLMFSFIILGHKSCMFLLNQIDSVAHLIICFIRDISEASPHSICSVQHISLRIASSILHTRTFSFKHPFHPLILSDSLSLALNSNQYAVFRRSHCDHSHVPTYLFSLLEDSRRVFQLCAINVTYCGLDRIGLVTHHTHSISDGTTSQTSPP